MVLSHKLLPDPKQNDLSRHPAGEVDAYLRAYTNLLGKLWHVDEGEGYTSLPHKLNRKREPTLEGARAFQLNLEQFLDKAEKTGFVSPSRRAEVDAINSGELERASYACTIFPVAELRIYVPISQLRTRSTKRLRPKCT